MKKIYLLFIHFIIGCLVFKSINAQAPQWAWARSYGGSGNEQGKKIAADSRNAVYTYGSLATTLNMDATTLFNNGGTDLFLIKHDTLGTVQWANAFGENGGFCGEYYY